MVLSLLLIPIVTTTAVAGSKGKVNVNVLLNTHASRAILSDLGRYGKVREVLYEVDALTMQATLSNLDKIRKLSYVKSASPDAERFAVPIDPIVADNFENGWSSWNLDVINITAGPGPGSRAVAQNGSGVYVAVLDTGLVDSWRQYFPQERIATEYAVSFGGGGAQGTNVSMQPNKWEHDQDSHGTHVTSTILGYNFLGDPQEGVAPLATVIPVKVLNQNGSGWSSVIAQGILYVAMLKEGPLADYPVVINMSLGGPVLDAVEQAALDYAIGAGVHIVASAGNAGEDGMGYPGAYAPVISVAASGWIGEWFPLLGIDWWWALNDPDPNDAANYYIVDFSSRELDGQDLDVAAPGSWVVGPYKLNSNNQLSYYFLGGTSMASPHVAGVVALMLEKNPDLTQADTEAILEGTALPLDPGCRFLFVPGSISPDEEVCWEADATGAGVVMADAALTATPDPVP